VIASVLLVIGARGIWGHLRDKGRPWHVLASGLSGRTEKVVSFFVMLLVSTALAALAVLWEDSTAVIIGAMLMAP